MIPNKTAGFICSDEDAPCSSSFAEAGWCRLQRRRARKNKSSEVVLGPFVSASSSLLDPCSTCCRSFPCGVPRAIFARAPGLPPTGKTYPTPRNSILPSTLPLVLLDQRFAIDPCLPSLPHFHGEGDCARVPDAAPTGKTLEAVKERLCFYSFHFQSQRKLCVCNPRVFS
jgi:hypothetical protein